MPTVRRPTLSEADLDQVYRQRIRPDVLDDAAGHDSPTAVLVGGPAGSGTSFAAARVRRHLAGNVGPAALLCAEQLRQYHPYWRRHGYEDPHAAAQTRADVGHWLARLTADAIALGTSVIYETRMREPQAALALTQVLRNASYTVSAVVLAADPDHSRQATVARYEFTRSMGDTPCFVSATDHDDAYVKLQQTVDRLEAQRAVDRIQLVTADGRQLYANELAEGQWVGSANAAAMLDDFRERQLTAKELADSALRWQTLVQRLATDAAVPREVVAQVIAWRNQAVARAEHDPQARQLLDWGREAEAFRTMDRYHFLREFPQYAKSVERLDEAIRYAEKNFAHAAEREAFVTQTRGRLAERIAEGRYGSPDRTAPERGPRTR